MHDLPLTQELDGLANVGVVAQTQDVVVGDACLLLGGKVLVEVGDDIALDAYIFHIERHTRGGDGVDAGGVIDKIGGKGRGSDLLLREIGGELVENGGDHLKVSELFGAYVVLLIGHQQLGLTSISYYIIKSAVFQYFHSKTSNKLSPIVCSILVLTGRSFSNIASFTL